MNTSHLLIHAFVLDVDECSTNSDGCSVNARCYNTEGSHICICNLGFSGNGNSCSGVYQIVFNMFVVKNSRSV